MDIADIFIQEFLLEEFDKKPLELQALEVQNLKEKHDLFNKRYQQNCGKLKGGAPQKHSDKTIKSIIKEIEAIKNTQEFARRKRSNETDRTAYLILIERVLSDPETEKLFIENDWISKHEAYRKDSIKYLANRYRQAIYRYKKRQTKT